MVFFKLSCSISGQKIWKGGKNQQNSVIPIFCWKKFCPKLWFECSTKVSWNHPIPEWSHHIQGEDSLKSPSSWKSSMENSWAGNHGPPLPVSAFLISISSLDIQTAAKDINYNLVLIMISKIIFCRTSFLDPYGKMCSASLESVKWRIIDFL